MQGTKRRGYCPFPALGRDTAGGVATGAVWRGHGKSACAHDWEAAGAAAHATAPTCTHDTGAEYVTWVRHFSVVTQFLMSRFGLAVWCCDMIFDVTTSISLLESRHNFWCRDQAWAWQGGLVS